MANTRKSSTSAAAAGKPTSPKAYERDVDAMKSFDMLCSLAKVAVTSTADVLLATDAVQVAADTTAATEQAPSSPESVKTEHTQLIDYDDGGHARIYGPPTGYKTWDEVWDVRVGGQPHPRGARPTPPPAEANTENPADASTNERPSTPERPDTQFVFYTPCKKPGKKGRGANKSRASSANDATEPVADNYSSEIEEVEVVEPKPKRSRQRKGAAAEPEVDPLERDFTAVVRIQLPTKQVYEERSRKWKTQTPDPLISPPFTFQGTIDSDSLLGLLAAEINCDVSSLNASRLFWRFTVPKNGTPISLGNKAGFAHFRTALKGTKKDKIVEFTHWSAPAIGGSLATPQPLLAAPGATAAPSPSAAAGITHWAAAVAAAGSGTSGSSGPPPPSSVQGVQAAGFTGRTLDEALMAEGDCILAAHPADKCQTHPDVHCYTDPNTGLCYDLSNKPRLLNWAANNLKGRSTRLAPPFGNQFFTAKQAVKNKQAVQPPPTTFPGAGPASGPHFPPPPPSPYSPYGYAPSHHYAPPYPSTPVPYYPRRSELPDARSSSPPPIDVATDATEYLVTAGITSTQASKLVAIGYTAGLPLKSIDKQIWTDAGFQPLEWMSMCNKDKQHRRALKAMLG